MAVLSFLVPMASALQAKAYVEEQLGGQEIPQGGIPTFSWRQAFPEWNKETACGVSLSGAPHKEGLTQAQLAKMTGIPQRHLSEMERGKRTIGKERAKKLAEALNIDYRVLL